MNSTVQRLIGTLGLKPLPVEGTLFAETWRSSHAFAAGQPCGTSMIGMYCEEPPSLSRFHRLDFDEVWHFHAGDPLRLVLLYPDGTSGEVVLGPDPLRGHRLQFVVPAGVWQAGHLVPGGTYALYGCTLAPGFVPGIFQAGSRQRLLEGWPDRAADIACLGCDHDGGMA